MTWYLLQEGETCRKIQIRMNLSLGCRDLTLHTRETETGISF